MEERFRVYYDDMDEDGNELSQDYGWNHHLVMTEDGEEVRRESDGGEPEDNSFMRDWNWVADAISQAYNIGLKHGKEEVQS